MVPVAAVRTGLWFLRGEMGDLGVGRRRAAAAAEVADRPPQSLTPSIRCCAGFFGSGPVTGTETVSAILGLGGPLARFGVDRVGGSMRR